MTKIEIQESIDNIKLVAKYHPKLAFIMFKALWHTSMLSVHRARYEKARAKAYVLMAQADDAYLKAFGSHM